MPPAAALLQCYLTTTTTLLLCLLSILPATTVYAYSLLAGQGVWNVLWCIGRVHGHSWDVMGRMERQEVG
jgi:hypothetical protein